MMAFSKNICQVHNANHSCLETVCLFTCLPFHLFAFSLVSEQSSLLIFSRHPQHSFESDLEVPARGDDPGRQMHSVTGCDSITLWYPRNNIVTMLPQRQRCGTMISQRQHIVAKKVVTKTKQHNTDSQKIRLIPDTSGTTLWGEKFHLLHRG